MDDKEKLETILNWADAYGMEDGSHHKQWLIDRIVRIALGCPTIESKWTDSNGEANIDIEFGESPEYHEFIRLHCAGEDGPSTYSWDIGCPP